MNKKVLSILAVLALGLGGKAFAAALTCEEVLTLEPDADQTYVVGVLDGFRLAASFVSEGLAKDAVTNPSGEFRLSLALEHWHNWLVQMGSGWWCRERYCGLPGMTRCAAPENIKSAFTAAALEHLMRSPSRERLIDLHSGPSPFPEWDEEGRQLPSPVPEGYLPGDGLWDAMSLGREGTRCEDLPPLQVRGFYAAGLRDGFSAIIGELAAALGEVAAMPEAGSSFSEGVLWSWLLRLQEWHAASIRGSPADDLAAMLSERCTKGIPPSKAYLEQLFEGRGRLLSEGFVDVNWPWDPGGDSQLGSGGPPYFWNAWADQLPDQRDPVAPHFKPVPYLKPGARYVVSVDLAGIPYYGEGLIDVPSGEEFRDVVTRFLAVPQLKQLRLRPVLLTDGKLIRSRRQVLGDFEIDLERIRRYMRSQPSETPWAVMDKLRRGEDVAAVFGRLSFEIETTEAVGSTVIGLSFWDAASGRPIEELSLPFCVQHPGELDCESGAASGVSLGGHAVVDTGANTAQRRGPAAALLVVELSPGWVAGVFKRNDIEEDGSLGSYRVWRIADDTEEFLAELAQVQKNFGLVVGDPVGVGQSLTNLLFPVGDAQARAAREALRAFSEGQRERQPFAPEPPVFFVRVVLGRSGVPALYPLGLMNLSDDESAFLGYRFRVDAPLPWQDYRPDPARCADHWIPVLPPGTHDPELEAARERLAERLEIGPRGTTFRASARFGIVPVYNDMKKFRRWLGDSEGEVGGAIVVVLSHHDDNAIFFDKRQAVVYSRNVARQFQEPSIVILSGCSTGQIGASSLLAQLNTRGVDAAIATNTGISGRLAGDFLNCLGRTLDSADATIEIADAFWATQRCLYELRAEDGGERLYGARVLSFSLAGNPSLALCAGKPK